MKKIIMFLLSLLSVINLTSCAKEQQNSPENNIWQRTALEIHPAESNANQGTVSSVVDLENFYDLLNEDKWEMVDDVPEQLDLQYRFNVYFEVIEPAFTDDNEPWLSAIQYRLYDSKGTYYLSICDPALPISYWEIDTSTAEDIINFAQSDKVDDNKSIETIVKTWGFDDFDKAAILENSDIDGESLYIMNDSLGSLLIKESADVTYAGIAAVSKHQKIEKLSANDETSLASTTSLHEIVDFMNREHMEEWIQIDAIPEDAEMIYSFVRSAAHKKTSDLTLHEMYRHVLYVKGDQYYVDYVFPASLPEDNRMDEEQLYFSIPLEVAEYLCDFGVNR